MVRKVIFFYFIKMAANKAKDTISGKLQSLLWMTKVGIIKKLMPAR